MINPTNTKTQPNTNTTTPNTMKNNNTTAPFYTRAQAVEILHQTTPKGDFSGLAKRFTTRDTAAAALMQAAEKNAEATAQDGDPEPPTDPTPQAMPQAPEIAPSAPKQPETNTDEAPAELSPEQRAKKPVCVHLTLTGEQAGRPLCDVDKEAASERGETFAHALYFPLDNPSAAATVCPTCRQVWEDDESETDDATETETPYYLKPGYKAPDLRAAMEERGMLGKLDLAAALELADEVNGQTAEKSDYTAPASSEILEMHTDPVGTVLELARTIASERANSPEKSEAIANYTANSSVENSEIPEADAETFARIIARQQEETARIETQTEQTGAVETEGDDRANFRFAAEATYLRRALATVGTVASESARPILSTVHIQTGDDRVFFTATDLNTAFRASVPACIARHGEVCAPVHTLAELLRLLPDRAVTMEGPDFADRVRLNIFCLKSWAQFTTTDAQEFPVIPFPDFQKSEYFGALSASDFRDGLSAVLPFANGKDWQGPTAQAVQIEAKGDDVIFSASNGDSYHSHTARAATPAARETRVLIHKSAVQTLLREMRNQAREDEKSPQYATPVFLYTHQPQGEILFATQTGAADFCTKTFEGHIQPPVFPVCAAFECDRKNLEAVLSALQKDAIHGVEIEKQHGPAIFSYYHTSEDAPQAQHEINGTWFDFENWQTIAVSPKAALKALKATATKDADAKVLIELGFVNGAARIRLNGVVVVCERETAADRAAKREQERQARAERFEAVKASAPEIAAHFARRVALVLSGDWWKRAKNWNRKTLKQGVLGAIHDHAKQPKQGEKYGDTPGLEDAQKEEIAVLVADELRAQGVLTPEGEVCPQFEEKVCGSDEIARRNAAELAHFQPALEEQKRRLGPVKAGYIEDYTRAMINGDGEKLAEIGRHMASVKTDWRNRRARVLPQKDADDVKTRAGGALKNAYTAAAKDWPETPAPGSKVIYAHSLSAATSAAKAHFEAQGENEIFFDVETATSQTLKNLLDENARQNAEFRGYALPTARIIHRASGDGFNLVQAGQETVYILVDPARALEQNDAPGGTPAPENPAFPFCVVEQAQHARTLYSDAKSRRAHIKKVPFGVQLIAPSGEIENTGFYIKESDARELAATVETKKPGYFCRLYNRATGEPIAHFPGEIPEATAAPYARANTLNRLLQTAPPAEPVSISRFDDDDAPECAQWKAQGPETQAEAQTLAEIESAARELGHDPAKFAPDATTKPELYRARFWQICDGDERELWPMNEETGDYPVVSKVVSIKRYPAPFLGSVQTYNQPNGLFRLSQTLRSDGTTTHQWLKRCTQAEAPAPRGSFAVMDARAREISAWKKWKALDETATPEQVKAASAELNATFEVPKLNPPPQSAREVSYILSDAISQAEKEFGPVHTWKEDENAAELEPQAAPEIPDQTEAPATTATGQTLLFGEDEAPQPPTKKPRAKSPAATIGEKLAKLAGERGIDAAQLAQFDAAQIIEILAQPIAPKDPPPVPNPTIGDLHRELIARFGAPSGLGLTRTFNRWKIRTGTDLDAVADFSALIARRPLDIPAGFEKLGYHDQNGEFHRFLCEDANAARPGLHVFPQWDNDPRRPLPEGYSLTIENVGTRRETVVVTAPLEAATEDGESGVEGWERPPPPEIPTNRRYTSGFECKIPKARAVIRASFRNKRLK